MITINTMVSYDKGDWQSNELGLEIAYREISIWLIIIIQQMIDLNSINYQIYYYEIIIKVVILVDY